MKNLKIIFGIVTILVATITISISCSKDESRDSANSSMTSKLPTRDIESMKTDFIEIMKSSEYITFHNSVNQMTFKMKDVKFNFKTRTDFIEWINATGNLSKTAFISTEDAIKLYDDSITQLNGLHSKFKSFYDKLLTCDVDEFLSVCAPEMIHPNLQTSQSSCQNACVDTALAAFHLADITYEFAMNTGDVFMGYYGTIAYNNENAQITQDYMTCFGNCPI